MAVSTVVKNTEFIENEINNTQSNKITITDDKLFRRLSKIYKDIAHSGDWVGALGLVVTITLTLVTSNFKDTLGLTAETWHTLFIIGDFIAFCYLIYALYYAFYRKVTIDDIIETISS